MTSKMLLSAIIICVIMLSHGAATNPSLDCLRQSCGNLTVSYPFGLTTTTTPGACPSSSSSSSFFELECKPPGKLYFNSATFKAIQQSMLPDIDFNSFFNSLVNSYLNSTTTPFQVIEINNDSLIVDISDWITVLGTPSANQQSCAYTMVLSSITLPPFPSPYLISDDNQFGSFGCSLGAIFSNNLGDNLGAPTLFQATTWCTVDDNSLQECGNHTCCLASLASGSPSRTVSYSLVDHPFAGHTITACNKTTCSSKFATLFHSKYTDFAHDLYRLKLKWALPSNQTSFDIIQSPDYACSHHAHLTIVDGVPGYLCSCDPGYVGDGYSKGSACSDIDECKDPSTNDCIQGSATCHNSEGSYTCKCNSRFYVGDGRKNGSGCRLSPRVVKALAISIATLGSALLMGAFLSFAIPLVIQWRQRTKRDYLVLNGGIRLQEFLAARGGETSRLFSMEELKAATDNFCDDMKLGVGGFGTVFKGTLEDGRVVAIKKANRGGRRGDNDQFLNEMAVLMHINHRHIVKLLGYCLEMETPLLVYEYLSNGNVKENLESNGAGVMGWGQRLKVARQTAEALAYLQEAASPPIFHRDVKSANVILDDNLNAKVADFGMSRLVLDGDVEHMSTTVQGTIGYLDPEYFQTLQFTHKSDVYSLGVILVELITGLKPIDTQNRDPQFASLALLFIDCMQEGRGEELIDPRLNNPSTLSTSELTRSSIMAVATLARHCLAPLGNQRPSMTRVAEELRHITQSLQGSQAVEDEALPLLPPSIDNAQFYVQSSSHSMCIDAEDLLLTMPR